MKISLTLTIERKPKTPADEQSLPVTGTFRGMSEAQPRQRGRVRSVGFVGSAR